MARPNDAIAVAACGGNGGSTAIAPVSIPSGASTSAAGSLTAGQQDSGAKASARNAETALETCYVDAQTYASCDLAKSLGSGAPALGSGPGQLQLMIRHGYPECPRSGSYTFAPGPACTL